MDLTKPADMAVSAAATVAAVALDAAAMATAHEASVDRAVQDPTEILIDRMVQTSGKHSIKID